jgi:ribosome-associated protein
MLKKNSFLLPEELSKIVVEGMQEKKAQDILVLDLRKVANSIADFFIICSGNTDTQVRAISESVEDAINKSDKQNPWHKEGYKNNEWVLLDYVDVVAHIFKKDRREFFALEDLWGDAKITKIAS